MKTTLLVLTTIIGFVLPAEALDIKAITAKPTANSPQYENKKAWPDLVGDEYFSKQKWDKARLLIWAPAEGAKRDIAVPASWIDAATGKPADAIPDMDTDVILPDAEKSYGIKGGGFACRHLTVGRNVDFQPGGGKSCDVFGNVWIRPGGIFFVYRTLKLTGACNTFFRNDWPADGKLKKLHDTGGITPFDSGLVKKRESNPWSWRNDKHPSICHFFQHDKADKTTEFIGYSSTRDEARIISGTMIVGRDSRFLNGGAAIIDVDRGASLALMDGAMAGKAVNQFGSCLRMRGGSITAGTPDRPIKRDARLGIGYSNWMNLSFSDQVVGRRGHPSDYGQPSARITGKLIGYPAEGSDARLVFGWQRIGAGGGGRGVNKTDAFNQDFAKLVPKITIWMNPGMQVENVRFEDLHRGGIVLMDAADAAKWKNVTYGDGCLSKAPKELIRVYKGRIERGRPVDKLEPEKKYTSM
ncbi:MAG: hypothetical protein QGH15_08535 [Kiritimatiellia bacterium]|nr:hypothetical protein [Kiritimatiellia bacterium]